MTSLVTDPIDHWLDLDASRPRLPLRREMLTAFEEAADAPTDSPRRVIWTGVATGYAVAFGLFTREALDKARRVPGALTVHPDDFRPGPYADEETAWASGVLYGYYQGASETPDATACTHCGARLVHDMDAIDSCHHGDFCEFNGCARDWHTGGGFHRADFCTYLDGE